MTSATITLTLDAADKLHYTLSTVTGGVVGDPQPTITKLELLTKQLVAIIKSNRGVEDAGK